MMNTTPKKAFWRLSASLLLAWSAAITARADYPATVLSQNPAAYYRLNETVVPSGAPSATNYGSLGANAQGSYVGSPATDQPGPFSGSVSVGLDGASQWITTPWTSGLNTTNFTYEVWALPAQVPLGVSVGYVSASVDIASPRAGWYLAQDGGTFGFGNSWVLRAFYQHGTTPMFQLHAPITNGWNHIVVTFDGTTASMYVDGVLGYSTTTNYTASLGLISASTYVPNTASAFNVGSRSDNGYPFPGNVALPAIYGTALSAAQVAAHYAAATSQSAYTTTVLKDSPLLYQTYQAPATAVASNIGTLGSAGNGLYLPDAAPGVAGPAPAAYPGFASTNTAVQFDAGGGSVKLPPFNFNTNTVTISGWVNASAVPASTGAGIILNDSGGVESGITLDNVNLGLGLGYTWANDPNTFNYSLSGDFGLAGLNQDEWDYVALVIQPTEADIYIASPTIPFQSVTNIYTHIVQSFSGNTFIGEDPVAGLNFLGGVDEVALWNRSLSAGELYTQYGSAVGGLAPLVFNDLQSPATPIYAGDPLTLSIDVGGTPNLSYQWYLNGNPIAAPQGTNAAYTVASFNLATDQGNYYVVVTNLYGSVTSAVATVSGLSDSTPAILAGPVGQTIYPGGTLNLSVTATGGGLTYQWLNNGVAIPGATLSYYKIAGVTAANTGSYSVLVTNALGATNVGPAVITVPTLTPGTYAYVIAYSNAPTAWWRLDETNVATGATLYDAEGLHNGAYTNNGGLTGGVPGAISGKNAGTALTFNGDGSYGLIPYFPELSNAKFTIEVWARQKVAVNNAIAVSSWDPSVPAGFAVGTVSGVWGANNPDYTIGQSAPLNSYDPTIYPGQWVHIVLEHGGTGNSSFPWEIYINGYNDGTYIYGDNSALNAARPFIIGGRGSSVAAILDHYFVGSIDEVAFYNKILTGAQVLADYNAAIAGLPPAITSQPLSQNAFAGQGVTFNVKVSGAAPVAVQWLKNGAPIAGATNTSLTFTNVYYTASGSVYSVIATNVNGSATSSNALLTVYYPPKFANLTNGLVLHLPFDGNYNDTSGHGNYGIPNNGPIITNTSILGSGSLVYQTFTITNLTSTLSNVFITSSNWVDLGTGYGGNNDLVFGATNSFTVSLWVKLANGYAGGDLPFIGNAVGSFNNPGWVMGPTYGTGDWQFGLDDGTNSLAISGGAINDGNWHNFVLAVSRPNHTAFAYLDGAQVAATDITGFGSFDTGNPVTIGQDPTHSYPEPFTSGASATDLSVWGTGSQSANLDDVGIWNYALSDLDARSIYFAAINNTNSFNTYGPVVLSIGALSGGVQDITWQSGTLKESTNLFGPWLPVPGAVAPFYQFTPLGNGNLFYRVAP